MCATKAVDIFWKTNLCTYAMFDTSGYIYDQYKPSGIPLNIPLNKDTSQITLSSMYMSLIRVVPLYYILQIGHFHNLSHKHVCC